MRKFVYSIVAIALLSTTACTDQNMIDPEVSNSNVARMSAPDGIQVDSRGYLVFASVDDFANYSTFLATSTLEEIQVYHTEIGFNSLAGPNFSEVPRDGLLNEAQQMSFVLDANGMVQVENTIMKPISNNQFMLTMQSNYMNNTTYQQLASGAFDNNFMNQFATYSTAASSMFEIITENPSGYYENVPNPPVQTMKGFGVTVTEELISEHPPIWRRTTKVWFFWICIQTVVEFL